MSSLEKATEFENDKFVNDLVVFKAYHFQSAVCVDIFDLYISIKWLFNLANVKGRYFTVTSGW